MGTVWFAVVTVMLATTAGTPVTVVEPVMEPMAADEVALIVAVPLEPVEVANPVLAMMVATD